MEKSLALYVLVFFSPGLQQVLNIPVASEVLGRLPEPAFELNGGTAALNLGADPNQLGLVACDQRSAADVNHVTRGVDEVLLGLVVWAMGREGAVGHPRFRFQFIQRESLAGVVRVPAFPFLIVLCPGELVAV